MSEVPKHQSSVPDPNTIANASANFNLNAGGAGTGAGGTAAQVSEYETGVSNGDVDWLFRGKSKKLTKKMNSEKAAIPSIEKRGNEERKDDVPRRKSGELNDTTDGRSSNVASDSGTLTGTGARSNITSPAGPAVTSAAPAASVAASATATVTPAATAPAATAPVPATAPSISPLSSQKLAAVNSPVSPSEKSNKLEFFKIGRTRSSSESSNTQPRRRGSLGLPSSPVTPGTGLSPKNTKLPPAALDSTNTPTNNATPASPAVSRSNSLSGGSKRSLFSSISSKFKSQPSSNPPLVTPQPPSNSSPHTGAEVQKPHINLLGVSGNHQQQNQDMAALINRPPSDIPKRKTSVSGTHHPLPTNHKHTAGGINAAATVTGSGANTATSSAASTTQNSSSAGSTSATSSSEKCKKPSLNRERVELRRVTFAIDKLAYDPQQQIPSRRPKKGDVIIPEDLVAPPPRLSQGISLSDGKNPITSAEGNKYSEKDLSLAIEAQRRALLEAEKHAHEAHLAARRIAHEVSQYKIKVTSQVKNDKQEDEEEAAAERDAEADKNHYRQTIEIDKPLHVHENYFPDSPSDGNVNFDEIDDEEFIKNLSLETIYTRCCHLREILPIPATLKQLKNKTKPLQVLKLLNPKPTLIDVLSFSDFIAITPINTVIFDNVTMTTEMLKHFLSSLVYNKCLEKLSLRNVAIDAHGWEYLCQFLSKNTFVKKLDISQQRIKSDTPVTLIRSSMNWPSLIKSLSERGGIEELVINGCKLTDATFTALIGQAVIKNTYRLGIAAMELNLFKTQVVADWINRPDSKCVGVDMAFNDLSSGQLKPLIDVFNKGNIKLLFFSLNSTKLENIDEFGELLKALVNVKTLRFLDLSSLPELFPRCISRLSKYLPLMPDLRRIHFDLNELTPESIGAIADILPKCSALMHVSFLGNRQLNHFAAGTLYTAAKLSKSLFTLDLDYDLVSDELSQRIAFYLMRNMDTTMNNDSLGKIIAGADDDEELMFDGSLLMETAEKLISANDKETSGKAADPKIQRLITNALLERTRAVRKDIHKTIDTLFLKRTQGTLSLEGKETLLRFCLLDSALEKVFHMFEEQVKRYSKSGPDGFTAMSPSPSIDESNKTTESIPILPSIVEPSKQISTNTDTTSSPEKGGNKFIQSIGGALGSLGLTLPPHDTLHESSSEMITAGPILSPRNAEDNNTTQGGYFADHTFQPHTVVVDSSSDGKDVPIDNLTGRPVLMRSISQTSIHAKELELEEGEFHRLGFYMQQREDANGDEAKTFKDIPTLKTLPSGSELRDAIIAAKGIEKVTDLIDNINHNRVNLDKIYNINSSLRETSTDDGGKEKRQDSNPALQSQEQLQKPSKPILTAISDTDRKTPSQAPPTLPKLAEDSGVDRDDSSIDSMELHEPVDQTDHDKVVDEVYDKLLNDAQRVRSNKQE